MTKSLLAALCMVAAMPLDAAKDYQQYYELETIPLPPGESSVDAVAFMPDGRLVCCTSLSRVFFYEPETKIWSLFAEGLHTPLGLCPVSDHEVLVSQRPEITLLSDTDGDGKADYYKTVSDDFGLSSTYAEWCFGPVKDSEGNIFFSLGSGSNGGKVFTKEVRGEYRIEGHWGRMNSMVPYRGWIMKVTPEGKTIPWAHGIRQANGLGFDAEGRLYASENQGDWVGSSALYHIEQDHFYGWAPSLAWKPGFSGIANSHPVEALDKMRTRPAVVFPHGEIASSPTQMRVDSSKGGFGPFSDQLFIGEMNFSRLIRLSMEEVDGQMQGACLPFFDGAGLKLGSNRLAFGPDGSLWVGQTKHGFWVGDTGLQRLKWKGVAPMEVLAINLTETGFRLKFTRPVDPATARDPEQYKTQRYHYNYHEKYGSNKYDVSTVPIEAVRVSADKTEVEVDLDLMAWRLYDFTLPEIESTTGHKLLNRRVVYTLNHLLHGTPPPPAPLKTATPKRGNPAKQLMHGPVRRVGGPSAASPPNDSSVIIEKLESGILFSEGGRKILRYVREPISRKDGRYKRGHYVHPLYALNGTRMSDDMPSDHPHHRGVFWAWSQLWVDGKMIGQPWEQKGLVWKVDEVTSVQGDESASIECEVTWNSPLLDGGRDVVKEKTLITVHKAKEHSRRIDFRISLLAMEEGIRIGGSNNAKGYGGFSARIPLPSDLQINGPGGEVAPNHKAPSSKHPWMDFTGSFDQTGQSGIAILTHSGNPGFPHGWTLRKAASCQNPVFPGRQPHALSTTEPLILNYSLVLHDQEFGETDLEKTYQDYEREVEASRPDAWRTKVESNLPASLSAKPKKPRKVLLYSTATGYKHAVIPRVQTVLKLLTEKTGAAELVISDEVDLLSPEKIGQFDAIIFNNCCSNNKERNLFRDIYVHQVDKFAREQATRSPEERAAMASAIENSVMAHIASGKGLMVIHGAITIMNGSEEFSAMVGASFDYHPKAQELTLLPVEPDHRLLKAFGGKPLVHKDEPYLMKGAYKERNFRPLLRFDGSKVSGLRAGNEDDECYVSWIKAHGEGRVFYVSPSHFEESYQDGRLLQYYLDGLQYVLGDLDCDDSVPR